MTDSDLARRVIVRHRAAGYLRFELPPEICHAAAGAAIEARLRAVIGVWRVECQASRRRLVVEFDVHLCVVADVARALKSALSSLPPAPPADAAGAAVPPLPPTLREAAAAARQGIDALRARIDRLRQAEAAPGSLRARLQPIVANALTEKAMINFLNDLVAFYLVKVHWQLISQRWLKEPVKNADAWLTVFYLMFLLVRYRKSIAAQATALPAGAVAAPAPDAEGPA